MTVRDKIFVSVVLPTSLAIAVYCLPRATPSWTLLAVAAAFSVVVTLFTRTGKIETRGERGMFAAVFYFPALFMLRKMLWPTVDASAWDGGLLFAICIFTLAATLLMIGLLRPEKGAQSLQPAAPRRRG